MTAANVVEFRQRSGAALVAPETVSPQSVDKLQRAHTLLALAAQSEPRDAIDWAYQAVLRCAGALVGAQVREGARRRGVSQNVWENVRKFRPDYQEWVDNFEPYARLHNEVRMGLVREVSAGAVRDLIAQAESFVAAVEAELGVLPAVA